MTTGVLTPRIRGAGPSDVQSIAALNNAYAARFLMLMRTPETIALALADYVVAVDERDRVIGCGSLKEYSSSLAEVAAVAVAPAAQGRGVGRAVVEAVEALALKRGIPEVIALTLEPPFFEALGYVRVDRSRYPEKIRRDCLACTRRFACNETCLVKSLRDSGWKPLDAAA